MMRWATTNGAAAAAAALIAAAGPVALGAPARAQTPAQPPAPAPAAAGGLFSAHGPVGVGSDGAEQFQSEGRSVWFGHVEVVQGQARMTTPRLTTFSAKRAAGAKTAGPEGDFGAVERIEAEGPVYYVTPTQQVKGDHGTYIAANDTITVTGNVTLLQGQDVLHGDKLVIEQKTGHSTMTTSRPGKGPERVRGVFFPKTADPKAPDPKAPEPKAQVAPLPAAASKPGA